MSTWRLRELLERAEQSEKARILPKGDSVYLRWMKEATETIEDLEDKYSELYSKVFDT